MSDLTGRTDDSPNLLETQDPDVDFVSILDIINRPSENVGVYMIKPGGALPKCQPKHVKNQFCSIHVKDVMY